ncbi:MAG: hypothetical protein KME35_15625 [Aphanocapsa sp. GSE-SYN-MK-11-07L]|jgi:hypothetical protein|nr:hypothetical protein [Aphanocapsa sp. GSE-SYN-MK-11-07L]
MPILNLFVEFSHRYCVEICAVLVPANLLATGRTLVLVGWHPSSQKVRSAVVLATTVALVMALHVFSWLLVGIVMPPTFILLALSCVCLSINAWGIFHPNSLRSLLSKVVTTLQAIIRGYRSTLKMQ